MQGGWSMALHSCGIILALFFLLSFSYASTFEYTKVISHNIAVENTLPLILWVNVTPDNPTTSDDLNCSFVEEDENNATIYWNVTWYKDGVRNTTWDATDQTVNNATVTYVSTAPTSSDTDYDEVWKCEITVWDGEGVDALNGTETIQSAPPPPGGGPSGGRRYVAPRIVCGNGICESNATFSENFLNCPEDCPAEGLIEEILRRLGAAAICGNGICEVGENSISCAADCPITCGNSICEAGEVVTCPKDCIVENILFTVDIVHTRNITLFYNFTKSTVIAVNNKGTAPLANLHIERETLDGFTFETFPGDIEKLPPGETGFFFVNMKSLIPNDFKYNIFIASDQLTQKQTLNIHIVRRIPALRDLLNDEFFNLKTLYEMLSDEVQNKKKRGYDVTVLETELADAKIVLDNLDSCLKQEDISGCNTTMNNLRDKLAGVIEDIVKLERITAAIVKIPKKLAEYLIWLLILLLIILAIILRWYLRRKTPRRRRAKKHRKPPRRKPPVKPTVALPRRLKYREPHRRIR